MLGHFRLFLMMASLTAGGLGLQTMQVHAEDWTLPNGKVYQNVTVTKTEPDAVTIEHQNGVGRIPLAQLPPQLQARFHYDAAAAQQASEAREAQAQAAAQQAEAEQMAAQALASPTSAGPSTNSSSTLSDRSGQPHYTMGQLVDSMHQLKPDANDTKHYSMGQLTDSMHQL